MQYFCNMYSEHVKTKYGEVDLTTRMVLEVGKLCGENESDSCCF